MAESSDVLGVRRLVTERCLIAADIDKTIVARGEDREKQDFLRQVGPQLIESAKLGAQLAFITGNSMDELANRFLRWLLNQLCFCEELHLLGQFHFFCNSAGIYLRLPPDDESLVPFVDSSRMPDADINRLSDALLETITYKDEDRPGLAILPRFIDPVYVERCLIADSDVATIQLILEETAKAYMSDLRSRQSQYARNYDLGMISKDGGLEEPRVELRYFRYGAGEAIKRATVQITLKPILSFHQAHRKSSMFGRDLRTKMVSIIQASLDAAGLAHYMARPGGRVSIDITLEKLDKALSLEFLIDRLNLQGSERKGQQFGSNAMYFGDEVIAGGGNDFAVTRIPGVLVLAVNPQRDLVPVLSHVLVPSTILEGPKATAQVLAQFNQCAERLLRQSNCSGGRRRAAPVRSAIETLKEEMFAERTRHMIASLEGTAEDWQILHTLVSLMGRSSPTARQWLPVLLGEFNAAMQHLAVNGELRR